MMRNISKILVLNILMVLIFVQCTEKKEAIDTAKQDTLHPVEQKEIKTEQSVKGILKDLEYGKYIKDVKVSRKMVVLQFFASYGEFKSLNADNAITESEYKEFWADKNNLACALVEVPALLLTHIKDLEIIDLSVYSDDALYYMAIPKAQFSTIVGLELTNWSECKSYLSANNFEKRDAFLEKIKQKK